MGVEQSNTSLVFDDRLVLKLYRRLEPGVNPELELLRFLTEHGFPNIPALEGWAQYLGKPMDATLATLQHFVASEGDGWKLALDSLAGDPERFLGGVRRLGEVTGAMHTVLASDSIEPAFCPEEPSAEALALLVATVDEEIEELFLSLPDDPALEPIAGRGEEVREQLRLASHVGATGRVIRHHGDYHLGQVLWADEDWVVIDFEGEPARGLTERRRKRSPLRDVAGMLRSFAYAASASELERGVEPAEDWEDRARVRSSSPATWTRSSRASSRPARRSTGCSRCSSSRRRSTSSATSSTTGRTGCGSRSPGSRGLLESGTCERGRRARRGAARRPAQPARRAPAERQRRRPRLPARGRDASASASRARSRSSSSARTPPGSSRASSTAPSCRSATGSR